MRKNSGRLNTLKKETSSNPAGSEDKKRKGPSGMSAVSRESQLVHLAVDLAEKQMREGTASAQVILHYLKLGSSLYQLERAKLEHETMLLQSKTKQIDESELTREAYEKALEAYKTYSGEYSNERDD